MRLVTSLTPNSKKVLKINTKRRRINVISRTFGATWKTERVHRVSSFRMSRNSQEKLVRKSKTYVGKSQGVSAVFRFHVRVKIYDFVFLWWEIEVLVNGRLISSDWWWRTHNSKICHVMSFYRTIVKFSSIKSLTRLKLQGLRIEQSY